MDSITGVAQTVLAMQDVQTRSSIALVAMKSQMQAQQQMADLVMQFSQYSQQGVLQSPSGSTIDRYA